MRSLQVNTTPRNDLSLDAGDMIHQIAIYAQQPSEDASGPMVVHQPLMITYGSIEINRTTDSVREGEVTTHTWLTIGVWFDPRIFPNMRVRTFNGWYVIQGIDNPMNRNVVMWLDCIAIRGWGDSLGAHPLPYNEAIYGSAVFSPGTGAGRYEVAEYGTGRYAQACQVGNGPACAAGGLSGAANAKNGHSARAAGGNFSPPKTAGGR